MVLLDGNKIPLSIIAQRDGLRQTKSAYLSLRMTGKLHTGSWRGDVREREHLGCLIVDWKMILKWILKNWDRGLVWLRIGTGDGHS
jgi:hypothetical protein